MGRVPWAMVIALAVAGCASPYAEVSPRKPHLTGPPGSGTLASVEQELDRAIREHRFQPLQALGHCLDALEATTRELRRDPSNATAIRDYDFAIGRIFQIPHALVFVATANDLDAIVRRRDGTCPPKPDLACKTKVVSTSVRFARNVVLV
jgi:hypothetical protein